MASADIGKKQGAKGFITSHYPIDELTLTWHILCSVVVSLRRCLLGILVQCGSALSSSPWLPKSDQ